MSGSTIVVMSWLMQEWMARLFFLRGRLGVRIQEPDAWLLRIRKRILDYLVARYQDAPPPAGGEQAAVPAERPRKTVCRVTPEDRPPRKREDLGGLLVEIRAINASKRGRWRWWL